MQLVYPPKFCISIVFDFSWGDCNTREKLETMVYMQNFGGQTRCIMVYVKMVNCWFANDVKESLLVVKNKMHFSPLGTRRHWQSRRLFSSLWTVKWWRLAFIDNSNDTSWCLSDLHQPAQGSSTPMSFSQMLISICY